MKQIELLLRSLQKPRIETLPAPPYRLDLGRETRLGLAVESMRRHMTDEGWQIFAGLEHAGYALCGHDLPIPDTDVEKLLCYEPSVIVLQDKREWDTRPGDFREEKARFVNVSKMRADESVFRVTILKDSHQKPHYHRDAAEEMGCHAWVIYYHPTIVKHLAPYVREEHCIRTYHSIDADKIPRFAVAGRKGVLLSGAVSSAYPLRSYLVKNLNKLRATTYLRHPGYHRHGSATPEFLETLNNYAVSICTSSRFGYALRKIIESVACGAIPITDLPTDEVLPEIDGALVRISPGSRIPDLNELIGNLLINYDADERKMWAEKAKAYYDYRVQGVKLAEDIERLRRGYERAAMPK